MKPFCTIVLSLLLFTTTRAQAQTVAPPQEHRFFAGLSLGPSFPTGKFAGKNYSDTTVGLAKAGPSLSISVGYLLTRSVGIVLLFGAQENRQDPNSISSYLKQQYGDTIGTFVTTHNWKIARILGGGTFKFSLAANGKLFFQSKVLAGVLKTSLPGYSYAYGQIIPNLNNPGNYKVMASYSGIALNWAFCYQANAGLGWQLTKRISLVGDISYFHAAQIHKYDHYLIFNPGGGFSDRGPWQRKYVVSSVNLMAGAEIQF